MIYAYAKQYGSITPISAFGQLGITKLATRISEMTRSGEYSVKKTPCVFVSKNGAKVHYMEYSNIVKKRRTKNESK